VLTLGIDVLHARRDSSEDAMHHLVSVIEQEDGHPAANVTACGFGPELLSRGNLLTCRLVMADGVSLKGVKGLTPL